MLQGEVLLSLTDRNLGISRTSLLLLERWNCLQKMHLAQGDRPGVVKRAVG